MATATETNSEESSQSLLSWRQGREAVEEEERRQERFRWNEDPPCYRPDRTRYVGRGGKCRIEQLIKRMKFEAAEEERQRLRRWRDERRTLALNASRRRGSYRASASDARLGGSGSGVGDTRRQWIALAAAFLYLFIHVMALEKVIGGAASGTDEQAEHHNHTWLDLNRVSNGRALVQNARGVGGGLGGGGSGYTVSFPSSPSNEIMSAGASSGFAVGGGDYALGGRGHGGSQNGFFDGTGGPFLVIQINDQGSVSATPPAEVDGPAQRALQSVFGALVPLCFTLLPNDSTPKGGYIKVATYAGLGLITGFTFVGLVSNKMSKAAVRVVASASMAAVSIAIVYIVSDKVYIQWICGIVGAAATFAPIVIHW